jgi:putative membrane protein
MEAYYNYFKALHLIFVITWFAGLFYMPRLFIYWIEAQDKSDLEKDILTRQFQLMAKRLWYIITWPSAVLAVAFALLLIYLMPQWLTESWMLIKLIFVLVLVLYHFKTHQLLKQMQNNVFQYSANFMRFWNEGATLLLFAIVFLAILKSAFHWVFGVIGLVALGGLLFLGIRLYKSYRAKSDKD